jgi:hypothetical protein
LSVHQQCTAGTTCANNCHAACQKRVHLAVLASRPTTSTTQNMERVATARSKPSRTQQGKRQDGKHSNWTHSPTHLPSECNSCDHINDTIGDTTGPDAWNWKRHSSFNKQGTINTPGQAAKGSHAPHTKGRSAPHAVDCLMLPILTESA